MSVFRKLYVNNLVPTKIAGDDVLETDWADLKQLSNTISFVNEELNVSENLYLEDGYDLTVRGGNTTLKGDTSIQAGAGGNGDLTVAGSVTVTGGLTVTGTTTTVNTTNLNVADRVITLNNGETGQTGVSGDGLAGIEVDRGGVDLNTRLQFNEANDKWQVYLKDYFGTNINEANIALLEKDQFGASDHGKFPMWDTAANCFTHGSIVENENNLTVSKQVVSAAGFAGPLSGNVTGNVTGTVSDLSNHNTDNLQEGTNLYFTDSRARGAISVTDSGGDGSLEYDSGSGVITYTGPSASEVRSHFTGGTGVEINSEGEISIGQSVRTTDDVAFNNLEVNGHLKRSVQFGLELLTETLPITQDITICFNPGDGNGIHTTGRVQLPTAFGPAAGGKMLTIVHGNSQDEADIEIIPYTNPIWNPNNPPNPETNPPPEIIEDLAAGLPITISTQQHVTLLSTGGGIWLIK